MVSPSQRPGTFQRGLSNPVLAQLSQMFRRNFRHRLNYGCRLASTQSNRCDSSQTQLHAHLRPCAKSEAKFSLRHAPAPLDKGVRPGSSRPFIAGTARFVRGSRPVGAAHHAPHTHDTRTTQHAAFGRSDCHTWCGRGAAASGTGPGGRGASRERREGATGPSRPSSKTDRYATRLDPWQTGHRQRCSATLWAGLKGLSIRTLSTELSCQNPRIHIGFAAQH